MPAPNRRPIRNMTLPRLFRALRNGLRPHTALIAAMVAAAGSPVFASGPAGRFVLHTNQERIVRHTNQGLQGLQGMQGLLSSPGDPVPWLGLFGAAEMLAMSPGSVTELPAPVPLFDVPLFDVSLFDVPTGVRALPETWAHGNSPRAAGSIPAPASLPLLGLAVLARAGRARRRRFDRPCTVGCVK